MGFVVAVVVGFGFAVVFVVGYVGRFKNPCGRGPAGLGVDDDATATAVDEADAVALAVVAGADVSVGVTVAVAATKAAEGAEIAGAGLSARSSTASRALACAAPSGLRVTMIRNAIAAIAPAAALAAARNVRRRTCSFGRGGGRSVVVSVTDVT